MLAFVDNMIGWVGGQLAESETEDPLDRMEEYIDGFVIDPGDEDRETFALALLELRVQAVHNEQFREKLAVHYENNVGTVADIVADGVETGVFRDVDPEAVGEFVYTSLVGARMYQVTMSAEHASRRLRDNLAAFVVDNLLADGRATSEYSGEGW
jgi:AcrR family transcriptional regulator